ncbi:hypothetical protein [Methanobrevibacter sp.]|uniref:hypothetical protein n=1 Tax=Methanobrevibacter sp. TaxID=66852 RepID=UPI003890A17A
MSDTNYIGNGSSIFKTIGLLIAGYTTPWLIKMLLLHFGIDLTGQETEIMQGLGLIIGIVLSYIDMKYTNNFFKKNEITIEDYIQYGVKHFGLQKVTAECECETCGDNDDIT